MANKVVNINELKNNFSWRKYVKVGIFFIVLLALLLFLFTNVYIVKEGEFKVVRQFGEIVRIDKSPGLKVKVPFVQSITTLPKYQMGYDVSEAEINTKDKKRMIIDNYAIWRIDDPIKMITNARSLESAETRMEEFIYSVVRTELGQLDYDQIINEKSSRGSINDRITQKVNELLTNDNYGISVTDVRIKRTDLQQKMKNLFING